LTVVIYGERLNLRSYWSGSWLSVWHVDLAGPGAITGTIKVRGIGSRREWLDGIVCGTKSLGVRH
jgi:hypothetical protein